MVERIKSGCLEVFGLAKANPLLALALWMVLLTLYYLSKWNAMKAALL